MSYEIRFSDTFKKAAKALAKKYPSLKQDLTQFVAELAETPDIGVPLGNNIFKIRLKISSKGRGKSAGARIITCVLYKKEQVLLADIYDKGDYSSVDENIILSNLKREGLINESDDSNRNTK